jgi:hypothetical protein
MKTNRNFLSDKVPQAEGEEGDLTKVFTGN